jgi:hypothetical protein
MELLIAIAAVLACGIAAARYRMALNRERNASEVQRIEFEERMSRYSNILSVEDEVERLVAMARDQEDVIAELRASYAAKRVTYDSLMAELAVIDDRLSFAEMGVYAPHFEFRDSEQFKAAIVGVRENQKAMISAKVAVTCPVEWAVDGSKAKGRTMTNRSIRLTLRAFNGECDAAIANARWNNVNAMEKRILRAREQIEKLNESSKIYIYGEYVNLKLQELYLVHEYREKQKLEREERAEALRIARDEQKLLRDLEQAEEQERYYASLLEEAQTEAALRSGPQLHAYAQKIERLERDLSAAHSKAERAKALAEQTRSGYVYIISNVGSFGEGIVKIGMTRRLDPMDRVRELGDASVPFVFDTHAIIYSDDAPTLERALHDRFESTRINTQNFRKEFFRASISEVESHVAELAPRAQFFRDIEAQEYRETLSRRALDLEAAQAREERLPLAI